MRRVALLLLIFIIGCVSAPSTEVDRPKIFPDRTTPDACWRTFVWAWRSGDTAVLEQTYGHWLREELLRQIEVQGRAKVSDYYRKDAQGLVIEDAHWDRQSELLAYMTARLGKPGAPPIEVRFAFLKRDDGWCIDGRKTLR